MNLPAYSKKPKQTHRAFINISSHDEWRLVVSKRYQSIHFKEISGGFDGFNWIKGHVGNLLEVHAEMLVNITKPLSVREISDLILLSIQNVKQGFRIRRYNSKGGPKAYQGQVFICPDNYGHDGDPIFDDAYVSNQLAKMLKESKSNAHKSEFSSLTEQYNTSISKATDDENKLRAIFNYMSGLRKLIPYMKEHFLVNCILANKLMIQEDLPPMIVLDHGESFKYFTTFKKEVEYARNAFKQIASGKGTQLESTQDITQRYIRTQSETYPLHIAVQQGVLGFCQHLIASGADCNLINPYQNTPLILAAYQGNLEAVKLMTQTPNTDVNIKGQLGRTAYYWAKLKGHNEVAAWLLEEGANPSIADDFNMSADGNGEKTKEARETRSQALESFIKDQTTWFFNGRSNSMQEASFMPVLLKYLPTLTASDSKPNLHDYLITVLLETVLDNLTAKPLMADQLMTLVKSKKASMDFKSLAFPENPNNKLIQDICSTLRCCKLSDENLKYMLSSSEMFGVLIENELQLIKLISSNPGKKKYIYEKLFRQPKLCISLLKYTFDSEFSPILCELTKMSYRDLPRALTLLQTIERANICHPQLNDDLGLYVRNAQQANRSFMEDSEFDFKLSDKSKAADITDLMIITDCNLGDVLRVKAKDNAGFTKLKKSLADKGIVSHMRSGYLEVSESRAIWEALNVAERIEPGFSESIAAYKLETTQIKNQPVPFWNTYSVEKEKAKYDSTFANTVTSFETSSKQTPIRSICISESKGGLLRVSIYFKQKQAMHQIRTRLSGQGFRPLLNPETDSVSSLYTKKRAGEFLSDLADIDLSVRKMLPDASKILDIQVDPDKTDFTVYRVPVKNGKTHQLPVNRGGAVAIKDILAMMSLYNLVPKHPVDVTHFVKLNELKKVIEDMDFSPHATSTRKFLTPLKNLRIRAVMDTATKALDDVIGLVLNIEAEDSQVRTKRVHSDAKKAKRSSADGEKAKQNKSNDCLYNYGLRVTISPVVDGKRTVKPRPKQKL